jgi:starch synthase (maltosyl-transferring)
MLNQERVVLSNIQPQIEGGTYAVKRIVGQEVSVSADVLCDGHDVIQAALLYKHQSSKKWSEIRMISLPNDEMQASFTVDQQGAYAYKVEAWVDESLNWLHGIEKKIEANITVTSELLEGALYIKRLLDSNKVADASKWMELVQLMESVDCYQKGIVGVLNGQLNVLFVA